jgi:hypothetical protein
MYAGLIGARGAPRIPEDPAYAETNLGLLPGDLKRKFNGARSLEREENLDLWPHDYNFHRPHVSLNLKTPASRTGLNRNNLLSLHRRRDFISPTVEAIASVLKVDPQCGLPGAIACVFRRLRRRQRPEL